jgi:hypothetical protein
LHMLQRFARLLALPCRCKLLVHDSARTIARTLDIKTSMRIAAVVYAALQSPAPTDRPIRLRAHSAAAPTQQHSRAPAQGRAAVDSKAP